MKLVRERKLATVKQAYLMFCKTSIEDYINTTIT